MSIKNIKSVPDRRHFAQSHFALVWCLPLTPSPFLPNFVFDLISGNLTDPYCNVNACVGHIHILALRNLATCAMSLTLRHGLTLPEVSAQLIKSFDFPSPRHCFETYAKNDNSIFSIRCSVAHFSFRSGYGGPLNLRRRKKWILYLGFCPKTDFQISQQGKYCRWVCLEHRRQCVILPALKLSWASSRHKVNTTRGMLMTITSVLNFEPQRGN